ncbi:polyprenyl synthetase family protein [Streptomyces sp. NPDC102282]|uniref:polyprenyl synthetase family protein n=1 Tax=Streptomyces sp. NPDC102282 TaxID=3366154 RepID=UPI0038098112
MMATPVMSWPELEADARAYLASTRTAVDRALDAFLACKRPVGRPGPPVAGSAALLDALRAFLNGPGKRVRPLFCHVGWRAVTDVAPDVRLTDVGVGLELLHGHALVHDDVVDRSVLRRGRETVHVACADLRGGDSWYGLSAAVFLGDLAALWAEEQFQCLYEPDIPTAAREHLGAMRAELLSGQLLDVAEASQPFGTVTEALAVIHAKTVAYTVRGPLLIGAAMAGARPGTVEALSAYARPLGEAFQLQDDLEDVITGADNPDGGEDLREGKRTLVVALAAQSATSGQRATMGRLLGKADMSQAEMAKLRSTIADTGAVQQVQAMVATRRREAIAKAQDGPFTDSGRALLITMADLALPGVADWPEVTA